MRAWAEIILFFINLFKTVSRKKKAEKANEERKEIKEDPMGHTESLDGFVRDDIPLSDIPPRD